MSAEGGFPVRIRRVSLLPRPYEGSFCSLLVMPRQLGDVANSATPRRGEAIMYPLYISAERQLCCLTPNTIFVDDQHWDLLTWQWRHLHTLTTPCMLSGVALIVGRVVPRN